MLKIILKAIWEIAHQVSGSPFCGWRSLGMAARFIHGDLLFPSNIHNTCSRGRSDPSCWHCVFLVLSLDVDECLEQSVRCGPNRMCFNMRGSYQCIDTPCPPNYQRDPVSGYVLPSLLRNTFEKLSLLNQQTLLLHVTHRKSITPGVYGVAVCSFLNERVWNELILQQPL